MMRQERGTRLNAVLAHDECTSGNVLNPLQRKKTCLFYVTFTFLSDSFASSRSWLPVAALTHAQLETCKGGLGGATAAFVRQWMAEGLETPFYVAQDLAVTLDVIVIITIIISYMDYYEVWISIFIPLTTLNTIQL